MSESIVVIFSFLNPKRECGVWVWGVQDRELDDRGGPSTIHVPLPAAACRPRALQGCAF